MKLSLSLCTVRPWLASDVTSLVRHANNRKIWLNLRDRFPHPYLRKHGQEFIRYARQESSEHAFAIVVDDAAVGGVGFIVKSDVDRVTAEIGYWLGEDFWGRGIATEAVRAITRYAIERYQLTRLFGVVFDRNPASARVLEKAGYVFEARLRRSAIKEGQVIDQLQYGFTAPESAP